MKTAVELTLAAVVLPIFLGAWGLLIVGVAAVVGVGAYLYRVYTVETLRLAAERAQAEAEAAAEELAAAEAGLVAARAEHAAACREHQRLRDALRADGWFVADADVPVN